MHSYYIIYKPYCVLSQFTSDDNKATLKKFFSVASDVYPVGRLDYDSEGLLLLTNDGSINKALLHPSNKHIRTYWVQVEGNITLQALQQLQKGLTISIDGKKHQTLPCRATILNNVFVPERNPPIRFRKNIPTSWISIELIEGKNRQVRKMTAAIGFPTLRLIRYGIEQINISNMQPGDIIELKKQVVFELLRLKK